MTAKNMMLEIPRISTRLEAIACVDQIENRHIVGRIFCPYLEDDRPFCSLAELVFQLDAVCDLVGEPAAVFERRSFAKAAAKKPLPFEERLKAEAARDPAPSIRRNHFKSGEQNFKITVCFRQYASMQGVLTRLEARGAGAPGAQKKFRSALELQYLVADALGMLSSAELSCAGQLEKSPLPAQPWGRKTY
ncbi:MAG: hypothetical protein PHD67_09785 [Oscillospiraceae bacterium]|nr:hypothetical protein [Oscillospiraceae bacterium]